MLELELRGTGSSCSAVSLSNFSKSERNFLILESCCEEESDGAPVTEFLEACPGEDGALVSESFKLEPCPVEDSEDVALVGEFLEPCPVEGSEDVAVVSEFLEARTVRCFRSQGMFNATNVTSFRDF